jgi:Arc/MetJ-type ribon-helix-helix transcriptional regulator
MHIVLSPETQRLLEERMKKSGYATADEAVRVALKTLDDVDGAPLEGFDAGTLEAIERAEAQSSRGEGRPWEDVRAELKAKYLNK